MRDRPAVLAPGAVFIESRRSSFQRRNNMSKTVDAIHSLLHPKSIAILGASGDFSRFTGRTLKYLIKHGYPGKIFPINPKYGELCDLKCYPSLRAIPESVETVFIRIPGARVVEAVKECVDHGVKTAVIHSAGMGESGQEGRSRQEEIKKLAGEKGLRLCGPNSACLLYTSPSPRDGLLSRMPSSA